MPLPVLRNATAATPADFIRLFHQSQLEWSRHLGEETELDFGRWIFNPDLPDSSDSNCLHDAFLIPGLSASQLLADMTERTRNAGVPWRRCSINPSAKIDQTEPLIDALKNAGWSPTPLEVRYRIPDKKGDGDLFSPSDLTIIPARASYRHYRQLMELREPDTADIALLHLDDSHVDSLLALRGGQAVGCISVLATGEVGTLREWFVSADHRRQGIGKLLLSRALEICARGLLRHVMIGLPVDADTTARLWSARGFESIGEWKTFGGPPETA
jgi:GNAT superfamily N-acetyltransferase